jgi:hypothetical protein
MIISQHQGRALVQHDRVLIEHVSAQEISRRANGVRKVLAKHLLERSPLRILQFDDREEAGR